MPGCRTSLWTALASALFLSLVVTTSAHSESGDSVGEHGFSGLASVIDGDSLMVAGVSVRLFGIDAPEAMQYCARDDGTRWHCGHYATVALDRLVGGRKLTCVGDRTDSYDRRVVSCSLGGVDVAATMVSTGWAVAYRRYSKDYLDEEEAARAGGLGLWASSFEMPWLWRLRHEEKKRSGKISP